MQVKASLNNLRIAPRKVRLVANLIKGMDVKDALNQLKFLTKKAAHPLVKVLNSAIANAKHNFEIDKENLYISKILVNEGPTLKRWLPRAFGRATPIMKRTSHITLILEEKVPTKGRKKKKKEIMKEEKKKEVQVEERIEESVKEEKPPKIKVEKRPYDATTKSKKRFFSRQGIRKIFQRKSF